MSVQMIIDHVKNVNRHCLMNRVDLVRDAVEVYFNNEVWSLEKDEWNKMTNKERNLFCQTIFNNIHK